MNRLISSTDYWIYDFIAIINIEFTIAIATITTVVITIAVIAITIIRHDDLITILIATVMTNDFKKATTDTCSKFVVFITMFISKSMSFMLHYLQMFWLATRSYAFTIEQFTRMAFRVCFKEISFDS